MKVQVFLRLIMKTNPRIKPKQTLILKTWKASRGAVFRRGVETCHYFTYSLAWGPEAETSKLRSVFILCKRVLVVSCWEWILSYKSYKYSLFRNLVHMAPRGNIPRHILPCRTLGVG